MGYFLSYLPISLNLFPCQYLSLFSICLFIYFNLFLPMHHHILIHFSFCLYISLYLANIASGHTEQLEDS